MAARKPAGTSKTAAPRAKAPARSQADALRDRPIKKGRTRTSPDVVATVELERQVFEMRKRAASFQEIADALGVGKTTVLKAFHRECERRPAADVETVRLMEGERLELAYRTVLEVLTSRQPLFSQSGRQLFAEVPRRDDPSVMERVPVYDHDLRVKAAGQVVRISESIRRLNGADSAVKFEVTGAGGGPVQVEAIDRARAGLEAMREARERARAEAIEAPARPA